MLGQSSSNEKTRLFSKSVKSDCISTVSKTCNNETDYLVKNLLKVKIKFVINWQIASLIRYYYALGVHVK